MTPATARLEKTRVSDAGGAPGSAADGGVAIGAAVVGVAAYLTTGAWRPSPELPVVPTTGVVAAHVLLVVATALPFLGLGLPAAQEAAARWVDGARHPFRPFIIPVALLTAVLGWAAAAGRPLSGYVVAYGALLLLPVLLARLWPRALPDAGDSRTVTTTKAGWPLPLLAVVVFTLWTPVELSLLPPLPRLAPVGVSVVKFVSVAAALWLFLIVRPVHAVGYGFAVDRFSTRIAAVGFGAFVVVALPLGFATGFLVWNPRADVALWLLRPVLIYFTIAVPEEFFFRGVLQRVLVERAGPRVGLASAAVVFGLAHAPSPVYIALATLAGVAYGWVYERTGRVAAAALTHALVDAVWVLLLRR